MTPTNPSPSPVEERKIEIIRTARKLMSLIGDNEMHLWLVLNVFGHTRLNFAGLRKRLDILARQSIGNLESESRPTQEKPR